jgi:predicted permease
MTPALKFFVFQMLVICPFLVGIYVKNKISDPPAFAKKIVRANLILFDPLIALWSIWGLTLSGDMVILPIAGITITIAGLILGRITVPFITSGVKERTTYLISSSLANHGFTMGGLICYLMAGEKGLGLSAIFTAYFIPYVFIFIFPFAKSSASGQFSFKSAGSSFLALQNLPLFAVLVAVMLHVFRIPRPAVFFPIDALLMISISLYYFTLGINFMFKDVLAVKKEYVFLSAIKFLMLPLLTFIIMQFIDLDRDIKSVIFIESFMPAAVYSVVVAILFDLDSRLASGMFVTSTVVFIVLILPVLFLLNGILFF